MVLEITLHTAKGQGYQALHSTILSYLEDALMATVTQSLWE